MARVKSLRLRFDTQLPDFVLVAFMIRGIRV